MFLPFIFDFFSVAHSMGSFFFIRHYMETTRDEKFDFSLKGVFDIFHRAGISWLRAVARQIVLYANQQGVDEGSRGYKLCSRCLLMLVVVRKRAQVGESGEG